jgi:putative redox protein
MKAAMKAVARRIGVYKHDIAVREHHLTADEPSVTGGSDAAPSPQELLAASLASCTATTMEMYAERKGWDLGDLEVEARFSAAERGAPTKFELVLRMPEGLSDEQVHKLRVIAAKCPVHRTLDGEVMFSESVERI